MLVNFLGFFTAVLFLLFFLTNSLLQFTEHFWLNWKSPVFASVFLLMVLNLVKSDHLRESYYLPLLFSWLKLLLFLICAFFFGFALLISRCWLIPLIQRLLNLGIFLLKVNHVEKLVQEFELKIHVFLEDLHLSFLVIQILKFFNINLKRLESLYIVELKLL